MPYKISSGLYVQTQFGDTADAAAVAFMNGAGIANKAAWDAWVTAASPAQLDAATRFILKQAVQFIPGPP
jgi:hypothetical protein